MKVKFISISDINYKRMDLKQRFQKHTFPYVIAAITIFSITIVVSILLHPGFSLFDPNSSLSRLGALGDPVGWVFDVGMVITGIFLLLFSIGMCHVYYEKSGKYYAMIVFLVASLMYIGFGMCPYGTPYHTPLAQTFFLLASISIFLWSAFSIRDGEKGMAIVLILLTISAYLVYAFYEIFGFPMAELYGGIVTTLWAVYVGFIDAKRYYLKKYSANEN